MKDKLILIFIFMFSSLKTLSQFSSNVQNLENYTSSFYAEDNAQAQMSPVFNTSKRFELPTQTQDAASTSSEMCVHASALKPLSGAQDLNKQLTLIAQEQTVCTSYFSKSRLERGSQEIDADIYCECVDTIVEDNDENLPKSRDEYFARLKKVSLADTVKLSNLSKMIESYSDYSQQIEALETNGISLTRQDQQYSCRPSDLTQLSEKLKGCFNVKTDHFTNYDSSVLSNALYSTVGSKDKSLSALKYIQDNLSNKAKLEDYLTGNVLDKLDIINTSQKDRRRELFSKLFLTNKFSQVTDSSKASIDSVFNTDYLIQFKELMKIDPLIKMQYDLWQKNRDAINNDASLFSSKVDDIKLFVIEAHLSIKKDLPDRDIYQKSDVFTDSLARDKREKIESELYDRYLKIQLNNFQTECNRKIQETVALCSIEEGSDRLYSENLGFKEFIEQMNEFVFEKDDKIKFAKYYCHGIDNKWLGAVSEQSKSDIANSSFGHTDSAKFSSYKKEPRSINEVSKPLVVKNELKQSPVNSLEQKNSRRNTKESQIPEQVSEYKYNAESKSAQKAFNDLNSVKRDYSNITAQNSPPVTEVAQVRNNIQSNIQDLKKEVKRIEDKSDKTSEEKALISELRDIIKEQESRVKKLQSKIIASNNSLKTQDDNKSRFDNEAGFNSSFSSNSPLSTRSNSTLAQRSNQRFVPQTSGAITPVARGLASISPTRVNNKVGLSLNNVKYTQTPNLEGELSSSFSQSDQEAVKAAIQEGAKTLILADGVEYSIIVNENGDTILNAIAKEVEVIASEEEGPFIPVKIAENRNIEVDETQKELNPPAEASNYSKLMQDVSF